MSKKRTTESVILTMLKAGDKVMSLFSGLLAAFLILYSSYVLYDSFYAQNRAFASTWDLLNYKPSIIDDDATPAAGADTLALINEDYRAWLTMYETNIDYPVMQGPDDVYYANRDIYKENSITGSIYLSTANSPDFSDTFNLIYGHHMDNQAMFGGLDNYEKQDYFDSHREGILVTKDKVYDLYVFAVVKTDAYATEIYSTGPNKNIAELMNFVRNHQVLYDEKPLEGAVKYLAMSTCADGQTSGRLIVFAVMKERDMTPIPPDEEDVVIPTPGPTATPEPTEPPGIPTIKKPGGPGRTGWTPPVVPDDTVVEIVDEGLPQTLLHFFTPRGLRGKGYWALLNLICTLIAIYLCLPLFHLRAKFRRKKLMKEMNEQKAELITAEDLDVEEKKELDKIKYQALANSEEDVETISEDDTEEAIEDLNYRAKKFKKRFNLGLIVEVIDAVAMVIIFILTEDIRLPMVLIDRWTPLMIILCALCWIIDVRFIRYREKREEIDKEDFDEVRNGEYFKSVKFG